MRIGNVHVVQVPRRREPRTGRWIEYDIRTAKAFGILQQPLFDRTQGCDFITKNAINRCREALADYSDQDSILALGDPAAIALTCVIAAQNNDGRFAVLRWDGATKQYVRLEFET